MADKLYEFRFYNFNLKGANEFRKMLTKEFMDARLSVSPVLGVWEVQLNGLAQFFHIGVYDNMKDFFRGRGVYGTNQELARLLEPIDNVQWTATNHLTILAPGSKLVTDFPLSDTAVYELQTVPEGTKQKSLHKNATLVGRFVTLYGPGKTEYRLIRYPDYESAQACALTRRADFSRECESKLMEPMRESAMR